MPDSTSAIRISSISRWAECETYALSHARDAMQRASAAVLVGIYAHSLVESGMRVMIPKGFAPPHSVKWDRLTANDAQLRTQALAIAREAFRVLTEKGWTIVDREIPVRGKREHGRYDLRVWNVTHGEAIVDLKTGFQLSGAWLQVGGYIRVLSEESGVWPAVQHGGVLHIPRLPVSKDPKGTLEIRSASQLSDAFDRLSERVFDVMKGERPTYSPGLHCKRCTLATCSVRES